MEMDKVTAKFNKAESRTGKFLEGIGGQQGDSVRNTACYCESYVEVT